MSDRFNLERFVSAQQSSYETALSEIRAGCKRSHWIWFVFPQIAGLGMSYNANYYGISCLEEARAYLEHPVLGPRLREITEALLQHEGKDAVDILGDIDSFKVRSSMTLFDLVAPNDVFFKVLQAFYGGTQDKMTLSKLARR